LLGADGGSGSVLVTNALLTATGGLTISNNATLTVNSGSLVVGGVYTNVGTTISSTAAARLPATLLRRPLVIDPSRTPSLATSKVAGTRLLTNSVDAIGNNLIVDGRAAYSLFQTSATYVAGVFSNQGALNVLSAACSPTAKRLHLRRFHFAH